MRNLHLIPFILAFLHSATSGDTARASDEWKAGIASAVITPHEPTWLSGYSSRTKPAEGKVHDLYAKALAIEHRDGNRLVLLTLDLGSVSEEISSALHKRVANEHRLPRASLVLNVSHTHCAPEIAAERRVFHALPDDEEAKLLRYIEWLETRLAELAGDAIRGLAPARLSVSKSSAEFGFNRRLPTADGFINSQNTDGVTDREVPVLRVADRVGNLRAILFGYACHNTTLAFQRYCGDYAGFAQHYIEADHPGATALFMMGCGGDQNPYPRHGERGLEYCQQHGRALADAVTHALRSEQREIAGPLRIAYDVVTLDLEPAPPAEKLEADAKSGSALAQRKARYLLDQLAQNGRIAATQTCPLHVARFGDELLFIGIGGETVVDYSLACKREFAGPFVWVAGYCDDVFAYLPSRRVLLEGGYEGRDGILHQLTPTPFTESVEDRVMDGLRRLVRRVSEP